MGCRRLAAIEIAASLLALDDVAAARKWTEPLVAAGFDGNAYHALRAAMVLAECDRRSGRLDDAVARLAEHREHIESESSNWQMAMYVRTFPHLLGMLTLAVGADELPVHMLRMVLPEHAERALAASKPWLDPGTWECLGRRVLGDVNFNQLEARGGRPICRVRLFGGLEVAVADRTLCERDWKKRKARLIFAMLVSERGRDIPREQFYEHLWPEMPEERARNNFYVAWSAMKGALMGQSSRSVACLYVENTGGRCRTVTSAVRSDVDEFEEALAEGRAAEVAGDDEAALAAYARLSSVYRGDLLPGDVYDDWFAAARDRYRFDFVDAMVRAAEMLLENDDPCEAIVFTRRALAVDGLREDLYQITLRCHIAAGQRSGAIDTFIQCRTQLSEELGLDPSGATMDLYQQILVMEDCPRYDDYGLS
jgi:DNA-binding SARP family transcriptional activator